VTVLDDAEGFAGPWHIWSRIPCRAHSCRIAEGSFSVTRDDLGHINHNGRLYSLPGFAPLHMIHGEDHILISEPLAHVLTSNNCLGVRIRPAVVRDSFNQRRVEEYQELVVTEPISRDTIKKVDPSGFRAWCFGDYQLFVSRLLKDEIKSACPLGLGFSRGFEEFLGSMPDGIGLNSGYFGFADGV
jgi:hypothetical protein